MSLINLLSQATIKGMKSKLTLKSVVNLYNGINMPVVGVGTWKILPNSSASKAVGLALKNGYRSIDTARIYLNEKGVGKAIKNSGIPREEIFVATKLWNSDQGIEKTQKAFDKSLKRLGLDYVDLYLMHWPVTDKRIESWQEMIKIYKSGRAKAIGVCNFTEEHLAELIEQTKIPPMVNQVEFHPFLYQKLLKDYCSEHHIILEAYSPLAHGKRIQHPVLSEIAAKHAKHTAQIMLRWSLQLGNVIIPKSTREGRIKDNIDIFDFELDSDDMSKISDLNKNYRTCWDPTGM